MQAGRKHSHRTIDVYDLLPPDAPARRSSVRPMRPVLVEDAVFEVVAVAPRHRQHNDNPARTTTHARFDLARLAAVAGVYVVNRLERMLSGLSTQAFATLAASLFFVVFWVCGGFAALDRQAVTTPASPFIIERVFTEEVDENGMRLLAVGGMLKNYSDSRLVVPELSVVGAGGELIGAIRPSAKQLGAGQSVRFFGRFKRTGGKSGAVTIFPASK
ncbi:hypothetical protein [Rhizobium sp.]